MCLEKKIESSKFAEVTGADERGQRGGGATSPVSRNDVATREGLLARAAKVLDDFQNLTGGVLTPAQYGYLQSAIAQEFCAVSIDAISLAAEAT